MTGSKTEDFKASFFDECEELLEAMQDGFDQMADDLHDSETMHAIFRAVHSIKGGAGAFGLEDLVVFAHHFETSLDTVRSGTVDADANLLELFRQCGDHLSDLVAASRDGSALDVQAADALHARLNAATGVTPGPEEDIMPDFEPIAMDFDLGAPELTGALAEQGFEINFTTKPELFTSGNEPLFLFQALERLGQLQVRADLDQIAPLNALDPNICVISWTLRLVTDVSESTVREAFEFVEDACILNVTAFGAADEEVPASMAVELPSLSDVTGAQDLEPVLADNIPKTAKETPKPKSERPKTGGTIRVDLDKVDKLINLVGELVIKEAMLSQSIIDFDPPAESDVSEGLDGLKQLASEIQEGVMAIRAQPVKPMFQRMSRIVREAAAATSKRVRFETVGDYTEVDKTVVERLVDPLTHMIRNAIDHGLEHPEDRVANGKPEEGTVTLSAAHRSGRVVIEISDDGAGVNRNKVRSLAVERGLIGNEAELSPTEIDNLLFLPGFSSKDEVSELSGRGVGLDVARNEIIGLGGRVAIQSTPGQGTCFSISLPLTLAVLEGMVIKVADQTLIVPISAIQETLQPRSVEIHTIGAKDRILRNRQALVPIIDLGHLFGFRSEMSDMDGGVILLVESDSGQRCALVVDEIQDQRQVVIKSLETNYGQVDGISAATILGDGRIALIIDPENIIADNAAPASGDAELQMIG
ncbi:chemotaxis protein CheA [Roseovarius rhodophyticola]|uniref:Chemotaxis protein CheA n=1 Tax=Roseovarius rhodophyticola TaxID=3080827 RepID=A0ABZ2TG34_9RHOB|nr:chemotaxis protein CheA [Roseovarius sp. W115]MDV2928906.1 chemotaxis protein CheA [Roseovarius sp. W115]